MIRYTLHVPAQLNDGSQVPALALDVVEHEVLSYADGFTRVDAVGAWRAPDGSVCREQMILLHVDSDDPRVAQKLLATADMVAVAFEQDCVYLTQQHITTQLVVPTPLPTHSRQEA